MTITAAQPDPVAPPRMSQGEFIAMMAMLFATIAFSIDAMLPAMREIGAELSPEAPNKAQLVLTVFLLGMGFGTFFAGPLSDSFGRKSVIIAGAVLYCVSSAVAYFSTSIEVLLAARLIQGIGAAGPRIVSMAIMRDLYSGREMARIMSYAMMIFTLVPAIAPALGAVIIAVSDWRGIFVSFIAFSILSALWLWVRQPETLPKQARRPLNGAALLAAAREVLAHPVVRASIMVQSLLFAALFATLSSIQQIFDLGFGRADSFPLWFMLIALVSGSASFLNASVVVRLGMRFMVRRTLDVQIVLSASVAALTFAGLWPEAIAFGAFVFWITTVFFMSGLTLGNVNAIAMEPMGHVAGMAASVVSAIATVVAAAMAIPVGLAFDGTHAPLALGVFVLVTGARLLMRRLPG